MKMIDHEKRLLIVISFRKYLRYYKFYYINLQINAIFTK